MTATRRVPDYLPLTSWPNSFHIPPQTPVAPGRFSDVDVALMRIDFELGEVARVLSRFAPVVGDRETAAVFLEPSAGSIYDDVDTWKMTVVSMTEVDHEHILEYTEDDYDLWH